jgi:outer membrane protein assembly factor BamE (lipoprotein component of BamABCDE complex)
MFAPKSIRGLAALASSAFVLSTSAFGMESIPAAPAFNRSIVVPAHRVTDNIIARVQPGMSQDDIVSLIGSPAHRARFPLSDTTAWDYAFVDSWGYASEFSVIFDRGGAVVEKVASRKDY